MCLSGITIQDDRNDKSITMLITIIEGHMSSSPGEDDSR